VVASAAGGARGLGFESRWRQIISVRGSNGICKYLPYFSSYLMLIMRAFVVSVCINQVTALYGYLAPFVSGCLIACAKPC